MPSKRTVALVTAAVLTSGLAVAAAVGVPLTSHPVQPSALGRPRPVSELVALLEQPGPVELETVVSSEWVVDRSGLVNLDHPTAKAAGLQDGEEPIQVFFHALRHPARGLFLVDTGMETALRDAPERSALGGMVRSAMHLDRVRFHAPLGEWLARQRQPLGGVLLTHLHLDHVSGMPDVPAGTPVYTGPGEASARSALYAAIHASANRALAGKPALSEWGFTADPSGVFDGAVDVFGDGSVWALWVPGHTPGSTAYLVRSTKGPVLLVGDASHTRWGWDHDVEPGSFTADAARGAESFRKLRAFAAAHPRVEVRLGHQH